MDEKLRDLERRAQSGDPAAASALSREVLRALEGARLEERAALARSLPALPLVLMPFGATHALVAVGESAAVPIAELPFAATSRALLEGDVVAGFTATSASVRGVRSGKEIGGSPFVLPEEFEPKVLAIKGPALYVGGSGPGGELLHVRDVGDEKAEWRSIEVLPELRRSWKTIDGLHVLGGRLVAVDDLILPKYLLVYDVTDPLAPLLERTEELAIHDANEHVLASAVGAGFLAVLSHGMSRAGVTRALSLLDLEELRERSVLTDFSDRGEPDRTWHDVAIVASRAVIAAGADGVAVLDLKLTTKRELAYKSLRFPKLALAKGEHVLRVVPVPGRSEVVAAIGAASGSPVARLAVVAVS